MKKSKLQTFVKCCDCDRGAGFDAKFRLASNCLNSTGVAQRHLPITVEFVLICVQSRRVACCNRDSSRRYRDCSPQTSPSPMPSQNCCWTMKELGEGSFFSCHYRGGQGCLKCLCSSDICHHSKGTGPAVRADIQQNSSWLRCLGRPWWNSFTVHVGNCPFFSFPFFPPSFCRFIEYRTALPLPQAQLIAVFWEITVLSLSARLIISVLKLLLFISLQSTCLTITKHLEEFRKWICSFINFWTGDMEQNQ